MLSLHHEVLALQNRVSPGQRKDGSIASNEGHVLALRQLSSEVLALGRDDNITAVIELDLELLDLA